MLEFFYLETVPERSLLYYCPSHAICMPLVCICMLSVCHWDSLLCHPYITRMYSYAICMSLVCTRMSFVYVTRMWFYHELVLNM